MIYKIFIFIFMHNSYNNNILNTIHGTCVVTVPSSRSTAVMEPSLWALLPPPSQARWPSGGPSAPPPLTARHSALDTRGTGSSLIRHNISPEFSRSNTCTRHRRHQHPLAVR